jgi:cytochrome c nitrite reductase small subunit
MSFLDTVTGRMNRVSTRLRVVLLLGLTGTIGLFAGIGTYTFYYAEGLSYFSDDPRACVNCHVMREHFDGWLKSPHHAVATCNDCHTPTNFIGKYITKAENGYWHSKGFTLQDYHEPIMIRPSNSTVLQRNCVRCHQQFVSEINTHAGNRREMLDCVSCHRDLFDPVALSEYRHAQGGGDAACVSGG